MPMGLFFFYFNIIGILLYLEHFLYSLINFVMNKALPENNIYTKNNCSVCNIMYN